MKRSDLLTHMGAAMITVVAAPVIYRGLSNVFSFSGMRRHISFSASEDVEEDEDEEDDFDYDVFED